LDYEGAESPLVVGGDGAADVAHEFNWWERLV
jgi:hypothetical protein